MAKKNQQAEVTSNEAKKSLREVVTHALPAGYAGRCEGATCYSAHPTFGGKLPEGEQLHKFQILLPIPRDLSEVESLYGYTAEQALERFVKAIYTDMDAEIKKALFDGVESPVDAQYVSEAAHMDAQLKADEWRYVPRTAGSKKTSVDTVVATLLASGAISQEVADGIKTVDDLNRAIMNMNRQ